MGQVGETMRGSREKLQVMFNAINLIENSGLCSSLLWKIQMYACGTLRFQSLCGDKNVAQEYEDYMRIKCGKALDLTGRFGLRQSAMLDVKGMLLKGDIGTNVVRQGRDLYLQGIEADRIGDPTNTRISNTYVRGLRLDDNGIVYAADVYYKDRMSGVYKFDNTFPFRDERGLPKFLFLVNPISYDDYRGVSVFKSAIDNSTYIDSMRQYELQALMWASSQSGVYHTKSGTLPEQLPFDNSPVTDEAGNKINTYTVRPNTVTAIGMGEEMSMFQHDRPSPNVLGMVKDTIRDICVGIGVSFEFGWDMSGLSGPAVRGVSSQDARAFETWQELLCEGKLDPVAGLILGNGIVNEEIPYHPKYNRWRWQFPAKSTIDASRESKSNIDEIAAGINTGARVCADDNLDIDEVQEQLGKETQQKIEIAMEVAGKLGKQGGESVNWREVYNYMFPPPKGAAAPNAGLPLGAPKQDIKGQTTDGVDIEGGNGKNGNGKRNGSPTRLRINGVDIELYSPHQSRDNKGRWEGDGGGGMSDAERAAHMKMLEAIEARGGTTELGIAQEDASEEGKDWKAFYAVDKRLGRPLSRMLVSPEKGNKIAVRLLQTMPGEEGKGYGTALLHHAMEHASAHGAQELISDPEGGTTKKAGSLWEKAGAKKVDYPGAKGGYVWQIKLRDASWRELWYDPSQARDTHGRFTPEGKGDEGSKKNAPVQPPKDDADIPRYVNQLKLTTGYRSVWERMGKISTDPALAKYAKITGTPEDIENWSIAKNVDASGNLTPGRLALHDDIKAKFLNPKAIVPEGQRPKAVLLLGQPGSGKTTAGAKYADTFGELTRLNPDDIRAELPEYKGWNAPATQAEAKLIHNTATLQALKERHNLLLDETGSNTDKMDARVSMLGQAGYNVHVIHVKVPLATSAQRIWDRYQRSGRFVDLDYLVNRVDHNPDKTYDRLKQNSAVKSWLSIDNTTGARVIDEGKR